MKLSLKNIAFISILSGLLLALSWSIIPKYLLIFIAFTPLLFIENFFYKNADKYRSINVFLYSFIAFFLWNALSAWWIYKISIMGATIVLLLNAILMSAFFQIYHILNKKFKKTNSLFLFTIVWLSFEYLHYYWFLSWPWFNLGNILAYHPKIIQWYEFTGVHGGTVWILVINFLFYSLISDISKRQVFKALIIRIITLVILILFPISLSLTIYNSYSEKQNPVNIAILQANINPYTEKFSPDKKDFYFNKLMNLAHTVADSSLMYIIAPETSITDKTFEDNLLQNNKIQQIKTLIEIYPNINFIVGSFTQTKQNEIVYTHNSALQIDTSSKIQIYHKSKLVLGSETVPFPEIFESLEYLLTDEGSSIGCLKPQDDRTTFTQKNKDINVAPIICYESIYGEFLSGFMSNGASLIFIITNDGYFEDSHGTELHFLHAKLRAIENRRSIARSANTGISGFINQKGDVIFKTKYGEVTSIKQSLNCNNEITFYTKYGNYIGLIALVLVGLSLGRFIFDFS